MDKNLMAKIIDKAMFLLHHRLWHRICYKYFVNSAYAMDEQYVLRTYFGGTFGILPLID